MPWFDPEGAVPEPPALEMRGVSKTFHPRGGLFGRKGAGVEAVSEMDLKIGFGESLAVVGESGSGKTTTARMALGLEQPSAGEILLAGRLLPPKPSAAERRDLAGYVQMVFQDPYVSLDPRQSLRRMLDEILRFRTTLDKAGRSARISELLDAVGLPTAKATALPSEISGGQRQRAAIARALAGEPRLLVLDEAVSALDTSIQAQILNLFAELRRELGLTYLFISHDLAVVRQVADRVLVMYRGAVVERGTVEEMLHAPAHPYTRELIDCAPRPGMPLRRRMATVEGVAEGGCRFRARCTAAIERCAEEPELFEIDGAREARCWRAEELLEKPHPTGGESVGSAVGSPRGRPEG